MGTVRVQGLGEVEIAGDTPTPEEARNILAILQEKKSERSEDKPPAPPVPPGASDPTAPAPPPPPPAN